MLKRILLIILLILFLISSVQGEHIGGPIFILLLFSGVVGGIGIQLIISLILLSLILMIYLIFKPLVKGAKIIIIYNYLVQLSVLLFACLECVHQNVVRQNINLFLISFLFFSLYPFLIYNYFMSQKND